MIELAPLAIGVGLVVSLLFSEIFGLAAGGMVVPGYVALYLNRPQTVALTLAGGLVTYLLVHILSTGVIIYGRRRTVLMILVGYLVGAAMRSAISSLAAGSAAEAEVSVIGYIIPGLIAIWIDRQGLLETFSALLSASVVVRLVLILAIGSELGLNP
jgi:poly-gamma-glutamate biosynthesis protein PgsC/CapC